MNKDYIKENQRVLDEWCKKFVSDKQNDNLYIGCKIEDYFAQDGIMNKGEFYINNDKECRRRPSETGTENSMWAETPIRILFLSKDQNSFGGKAKDVRTETFHTKNISLPVNDYQIENSFFYQNEACLIYRILQANPDFDIKQVENFSWEDSVRLSDEKIFARINCKKEIGKDTCTNAALKEAIEKYGKYLKEQINNLDADILICCGHSKAIEGTHNIILNYLNTIGYEFKQVEECGEEIYFDYKRNKVAFNIYHLSYRFYNWIPTIKSYYKFLQQHPDFIKSHRI